MDEMLVQGVADTNAAWGRSEGQRRGKEQGVETGGEQEGRRYSSDSVHRIAKPPRSIHHLRPHIHISLVPVTRSFDN